MKVTTVENITFEEAHSQAGRFSDGTYKTRACLQPINLKERTDAAYGKVDIVVKIKTLSYPKFEGTINYVHHWTEDVEAPVFDETTGEPTGETETVSQPHSRVITDYDMTLPYDIITMLLDLEETRVDEAITGKARLENKMINAMLTHIVSHTTFRNDTDRPNGFTREQYTTSIL